MENSVGEWVKFDACPDMPAPRMYHSFSTCTQGTAKGMLIVFGGRGDNNSPTNDIWGFRKHRTGKWDWTKAPYSNFTPLKRFQVSFKTLLLFNF